MPAEPACFPVVKRLRVDLPRHDLPIPLVETGESFSKRILSPRTAGVDPQVIFGVLQGAKDAAVMNQVPATGAGGAAPGPAPINLRALMMAQSVNGLPLSPRIPSAGGEGGTDANTVRIMFGEAVAEPLPSPTVWPSIVGPHLGTPMPGAMHPPQGLVQAPVAPVRPHNHNWYQSLTMGTIYSLVVGLRCEDPRLPSPRISLLEEVFRVCPHLRLKILEAVTQTSFEWMTAMKEVTPYHVTVERDLQPVMSRDHGAGLAELLNSIVSFVREDLGVASPLPCPDDDLSSSLDSDEDDLSDSDDEYEEDEEGGEGRSGQHGICVMGGEACAGDGALELQPHHSCAGLPMGLSAGAHPLLCPVDLPMAMQPLHLPAPMPLMQAPPPPPCSSSSSSSSPPSPQLQPPRPSPSSSPPSASMTTLSDITTSGHTTTLPTHCHHSTGPPLKDEADDAMVLDKEPPTPTCTPEACPENARGDGPTPHGPPHNWAANAALLRESIKALSLLLRGHAGKFNNPSTDKAECAHLRECVIELISAYPPMAIKTVEMVLRVWPRGNSTRESSFLQLLTLVLSCSPLSVFLGDEAKTHVKAFRTIRTCIKSTHAGVAEEALVACSNPRMIARYLATNDSMATGTDNKTLHSMVISALRENQVAHWHPEIRAQSHKLADVLDLC